MKKSVIALLLISILILPLVSAEENYSNFERIKDNVKMFFSFGDKKVQLALEIKEREINSAIYNANEGNQEEAEKNIENAWKKLEIIENKVSINTAEQVKTSSTNTIEQINNQNNLPPEAELFVLKEEKTQLAAEWVVVEDGPEGQTKTVEINEQANEVNNEIKNWVVEHTIEEGDDGLTWEVKTDIAEGNYDGGLKPVVLTDVAGGNSDDGLKPEVLTAVEEGGHESNSIENNIGEGGLAEGTNLGSPDIIEEQPNDFIAEGTVENPSNDLDSGNDGSNNLDNQVGGVDDGPGEPGVVDEA